MNLVKHEILISKVLWDRVNVYICLFFLFFCFVVFFFFLFNLDLDIWLNVINYLLNHENKLSDIVFALRFTAEMVAGGFLCT